MGKATVKAPAAKAGLKVSGKIAVPKIGLKIGTKSTTKATWEAKTGGKIKIKIGVKGKAGAKKIAANKWAAGTDCRSDFNLLWNSVYVLDQFKDTFKDKSLECAKKLSTFRGQMTCAVCDPKLGKKFEKGMPMNKDAMNDMLDACVPILYAINTFSKPTLARGLAYVKKVNAKAANLDGM